MISNKFLFVIVGVVCVFLTGCAAQKPVVKTRPPVAENYALVKLCDDNNVYWQWDYLTQVITLTKGKHEAKAMVGSSQVLVNGQSFMLSKPVAMVHSVIIVPGDFHAQVIKRLKAPRKIARKVPRKQKFDRVSPRPIKRIIVDAGHGGKDPGAIGRSGVYEKNIVLDISRRLRALLRKQGYEVIMTRANDTFISLQKRTEIASSKKADLFISIHANSSPSKSARGIEVFSSRSLSYTDKHEKQRQKNHNLIFKNFKMKKSDKNVGKIIADLMYQHKQSDSDILAETIEYSMQKQMKAKSRGVKKSKFFVLRNNLMPAVLVEVGFLSNYREEKLLKDSSYRQKAAQAIASGVKNYARIQ